MRTVPVGLLIAIGVVVMFIVVGVVSFIAFSQAAAATASVGWFAYEPSPTIPWGDQLVILTAPAMGALVLVGLGLVGAAVILGYAVGRRRSQPAAS